MSMADKLKEGIQKRKDGMSSEEELRDLINAAASKSLKQFIHRLDAGEIPIDNISDFIRILGAYKEINEIESTMEGRSGQASLPEINMRQERVLNEQTEEGKIDEDEEGYLDIGALSTDDVSELIRQMDIAQNKANEEAF